MPLQAQSLNGNENFTWHSRRALSLPRSLPHGCECWPILRDRAFPSWQPKDRLEMARNQFINGVLSSTIQLKLLQEQPQTLDDVYMRMQCTLYGSAIHVELRICAGVTGIYGSPPPPILGPGGPICLGNWIPPGPSCLGKWVPPGPRCLDVKN